MLTVRCRTCHRVERWKGSSPVEVVQPGGDRKPPVHPTLHTWRVLLGARSGETGPVVAACPACGQPMTADGPAMPLESWTLTTPKGDVVVASELTGPAGAMTEAEVTSFLEDQLRASWFAEQLEPRSWFAGLASLILLAIPFALWVIAAAFTLSFIVTALSS